MRITRRGVLLVPPRRTLLGLNREHGRETRMFGNRCIVAHKLRALVKAAGELGSAYSVYCWAEIPEATNERDLPARHQDRCEQHRV